MFYLDTLSTLVAATLVLLLGRKLVQSVSFLKKYTIPEPVAGGLLVAIALLVLKKSMGWEVNFDMTLRDPLMLAFFATIGLNANIASLRAGGRVCSAAIFFAQKRDKFCTVGRCQKDTFCTVQK